MSAHRLEGHAVSNGVSLLSTAMKEEPRFDFLLHLNPLFSPNTDPELTALCLDQDLTSR